MFKNIALIAFLGLALFSCKEATNNGISNVISLDPNLCNIQNEKNQALWGYLNEWYLWNESLDQSTDPDSFDSLQALLDDVKGNNPIDRWSGVKETEQIQNYENGIILSFGFTAFLHEPTSELMVAQVYKQSDAFEIGLRRGDRILEVNDISISLAITEGRFQNGEIWGAGADNTLITSRLQTGEIWGADADGTLITIKWQTPEGEVFMDAMQKRLIEINTVVHRQVYETETANVGYLVFDTFSPPAEHELNSVFEYFLQQNVEQIIVDLRYNGGGSSRLSSQLATQIAGSNVQGNIFSRHFLNALHSNQNFETLFSLNGATNYLELDQVIFLTTQYTASASEMLINGLEPYIDVKLVGSQTHGKPAGFIGAQLCDQTVFAVNIEVANADNFGDYYQGLAVDCAADDTVKTDWGKLNDPLLKEALYLLDKGQCSADGEPSIFAQKPLKH